MCIEQNHDIRKWTETSLCHLKDCDDHTKKLKSAHDIANFVIPEFVVSMLGSTD